MRPNSPAREPIAIIGAGCRFPGGADTPEAFWRLLRDEIDAVGEVPAGRWGSDFFHPDPRRPGKVYTRSGAFLKDIELFDAGFFGISAREASRMDPQHRLLLEVAWEALEDAGQVIENLEGTATGVFMGICDSDYKELQLRDPISMNAYTNAGSTSSLSANRISHAFDFRGPSIALDTACSSSLVAVHLACQSLWHMESSLALAGGVHLMLAPLLSVGFCKASMLSPTGRCHAFDARADGFVRGEGAGVVVLKRLSEAVADNDPIYALLLATAVNQDGHTPGISLPNASAQEGLLREIYSKAHISARQVQYVEAHGTGTAAGDPIECLAIGSVLGVTRAAGSPPCLIGSVKTNIGHLEGAAGIASLIKVALALKKRQIPASLHFQTPNPKIDFEGLRLEVQRKIGPWPDSAVAVAGVGAFGFGGTNAHAILKEYVQAERVAPEDRSPRPWVLPISARSRKALDALAKRYRTLLSGEEAPALHDLCHTASVRRGHHAHRLAATGRTREELVERLDAFLCEEQRPGLAVGRAPVSHRPKVAFVFSGNGTQWAGMAKDLLEREPVFREAVEECDRILLKIAGWSVLDELLADASVSRMEKTAIAQPALFAVQTGLLALWRSWGVEADAVLGHSVGEMAAAYAAGILSLEDALAVVAARSRTQEATAGKGAMAAVGLSVEAAGELLAGYEGRVCLAAVNGPASVTISGETDALLEILEQLKARNVFCRQLRLNYAFHSHQMDPIEDELLSSLAHIAPQSRNVRFLSTVTGAEMDGMECDASYWWRNVRLPVLFGAAIEVLIGDGFDCFLEIGPHPALTNYIVECASARGKPITAAPSLRRKEDDQTVLLGSLGALYVRGCPVAWRGLYPLPGSVVRLPPYPWQRERHWNQPKDRTLLRGTEVHPLLGRRVESPNPAWHVELDRRNLAYLDDHRVQGAVVFPGTGYIEMALAAAAQLFGEEGCQLEEIELREAIVLNEGEIPEVQFAVASDLSVIISSRLGTQEWKTHVTAQLSRSRANAQARVCSLEELRGRCRREISSDQHYRSTNARGLQYGPAFQVVSQVWSGAGEALGHIRASDAIAGELDEYFWHPALLDGFLQTAFGALGDEQSDDARRGWLPSGFGKARFYRRPGAEVYAHVRIVRRGKNSILADCVVLDKEGNVLAAFEEFRLQAVDFGAHSVDLRDLFYEFRWEPQPLAGSEPAARDASELPGPLLLAQSLRPMAGKLSGELGMKRYYQAQPAVRRLCAAFIVDAFRKLGWNARPDEEICVSDLMSRLGIAAQYDRLLGRLLGILEEEGMIERQGEHWRVASLRTEDCDRLWKELIYELPSYHAELTLLGRCGRGLSEALTESLDPLELIFPEKSGTAEHFYETAPNSLLYHKLLEQFGTELTAGVPNKRTLRILEIGAGTGGSTGYLLRALPAQRTSYVFTDLSPAFLSRARRRFENYPFVEYRLLDIEQDPVAQGFAPSSFDVVVASNVLHATADLGRTLANVRRLLASEGMLVLIEARQTSGLDLIFGLLKGWWLFKDTELRSYPLLAWPDWSRLLEKSGFTEIDRVADEPVDEEPFKSLILARAPRIEAAPALQHLNGSQGVTWLIFEDQSGLGGQLKSRLTASGHCTLVVEQGEAFTQPAADRFTVAPGRKDDMDRLVNALASTPIAGVIHCWSLDVAWDDDATSANLEMSQNLGCLSVIQLVQALTEFYLCDAPRLWLITSDTQAEHSESGLGNVAQAALWGLGRTLSREHPDLRCTLVDVSAPAIVCGQPAYSPAEILNLIAELFADEREEEILLRAGSRAVNRWAPMSIVANGTEGRITPFTGAGDVESYRLETDRPDDLKRLILVRTERKKPGRGEVEIEVCAAGLNFKDVMHATGLLRGEALDTESGFSLGLECAGRIVAVGEGVEDLSVGEEVVALGENCFGRFVTTGTAAVVRKPANLSFDEAATIPTVFLTAYYALCHLGRLQPGERVLIHAAAGGVGLAAIQIAQRIGAEIFATAGSVEKRDFLRALGIEHVMDSRTTAFADEIMEITGREGIDVVLNSLGGEAIRKNLSLLRRFGRYLEIGKRDLIENSRVGLRPFERCLSFFSIDLVQLQLYQPDLLRLLFREVMNRCERKEYRPLPYRVFPIDRAAEAFRCMQQSRHIGKLVLSTQQTDIRVRERKPACRFRSDATYLITGGLGGIGMALAGWMVANGARHLVLAGRRGVEKPETEAAIEEMRRAGAEVLVSKTDVSREEEVEEALERISQTMPPLRGVFHAALVLDDGIVLQLDRERLLKVMAPRAAGAWNLHRQTLGLPLDYFVLFSSFTSALGNAGQANYAAAGTFMDALAQHRRGRGLPGLTVNWGAVGDVGYFARNADLGDRFLRQGVRAVPIATAFEALGALLDADCVQASVLDINWQEWKRAHRYIPCKVAHLGGSVARESSIAASSNRPALMEASGADRKEIAQSYLCQGLARVLGISASNVEIDKPITAMGLDSLMAVDLRIHIERDLGVNVPVMNLMQGPSVAALASFVLQRLP